MAAHLLQVTLGAGANTQFSSTDTPCRQVVVQNNATHAMHIGDSTTSATKGILLATGGGGANAGPFSFQATNLQELYVAGTAADVLDVLYFD